MWAEWYKRMGVSPSLGLSAEQENQACELIGRNLVRPWTCDIVRLSGLALSSHNNYISRILVSEEQY